MMTIFKTIVLTCILICGLQSSIQAQDKYDFAMVSIITNRISYISIDTKEDSKRIEISENDNPYSAFLRKIVELSGQGWEVYNNTVGNNINTSRTQYTYYLRRKIN